MHPRLGRSTKQALAYGAGPPQGPRAAGQRGGRGSRPPALWLGCSLVDWGETFNKRGSVRSGAAITHAERFLAFNRAKTQNLLRVS